MPRKYKSITYQDRIIIEKMYKKGCSHQQIADVIGVDRMTMYREKKRGWNEESQSYDAEKAQRELRR